MTKPNLKNVEGWFKNHKVRPEGDTEFVWAEPGSGFYFLRIIVRPNAAIMYGDLEPIVVRIYDREPINILHTIRSANLEYLCGKLERPWEQKYDGEETEEWIRTKAADEEGEDEEERARLKEAIENIYDWSDGREVYDALEGAGCQDVFEGYLCYNWNHAIPIVYSLQLAVRAWFEEREKKDHPSNEPRK